MNNTKQDKKEDKAPIVWNDPAQNHFVLYMDIMGFKNLMASTPHAQMQKKLELFSNKVVIQSKPLIGDSSKIQISRFSDSILCVTKDSTEATFKNLVLAAIRLMWIGIDEGLPLRGAIACGKMTYDESNQLYFGKALIDAYQLEEELEFYGVAIHHSAEAIARKQAKLPIVETLIPLKSGLVPHHHIAWNRKKKDLSDSDETSLILDKLNDLKLNVSCGPRRYIANTITQMSLINQTPKYTIQP